MNIMISQKMDGIPEKQVKDARQAAIFKIESQGNKFIENFLEEDIEGKNVPLAYLAKSLMIIATDCDAVLFLKGWEEARGCVLEHQCCKAYGVKIIYEEEDSKSNWLFL